MILISYAKCSQELAVLAKSGCSEVLLGHVALSRLGGLDQADLTRLANEAIELGIRPILEWDILMTRPQFDRAIGVLKELDLTLFGAVRVQDPGAFEYALQNLAELSIQLILETGNHNLEAIQRWCQHGGTRLERVVLSNQLPKARLLHDIQNIPVPVEVLGLGPILLLYTPRHLLSNQLLDIENTPLLRSLASSEESFHSGFRVIENQQGTFVFHAKDYCLLDQIEELKRMNLGAFRVDFRLEGSNEMLSEVGEIIRSGSRENGPEKAQAFIDRYPNKVTRCFFQANATDVLFKKLKNISVQRQDAGYVGEVVEIVKGSHVIIHVLGKGVSLKNGQSIRMINPEGLEKVHLIKQLQNLDRQDVEVVPQGDFAVLPYIKLVPPKTAVYSNFN